MEEREKYIKDVEPTDKELLEFIGNRASKNWTGVQVFLEENYDFTPELKDYGKKYGWAIRYRKSGKTLTTLYPEKGGFTIQIVLGKKEVENFEGIRKDVSPEIVDLFESTKQFHDGRWLWIRQPEMGSIDDIKKLIMLKRKPKKKS
ncbi:MAG: DUF3788 domain-containing protein [Candidatus Thorarchaeota archaeon]